MPKILKSLVKSALCFIGLVVCSWLLMQLRELQINWGVNSSLIIIMFVTYILAFTLPFLVTIAYTYILFRLFIREPHCYFIIVLNGLFILIVFFVLRSFQVDTYNISYLDLTVAEYVSMPAMVLAIMYKYLSGKRKALKKVYGRAANAMLIVMKSFVCMCILVALALAGRAFMELSIRDFFIIFLQEIDCLNLLTAIVYAFALYIVFRHHKHTFWIIAVNSVFPLVVWSLIILKILDASMLFSFVCFNAALIPPVLACVFRSVEKRNCVENGCIKDSLAVGTPLE